MDIRSAGLALLLCFAAACSGDEGAAPVCADVVLGETFDLVDSAEGTQVQLDAALGRDRIWLAYSMVSAGGKDLDIFLSAVSCAGKPLGPPIKVNTVEGRNNVDPVVRTSAETIFVAWSSDDHSGGKSNLDIVYRTFDIDGSPRMAAQRDLETKHAGQAVTGNHWLPNATVAGDTLAIVGVRGIPAAPSFQAFVQRIDADGELVGEARALKVEADQSHAYPDIGRDAEGRLYAAWERSAAPDYKANLLAQMRLDADLGALDTEPQNLLGGKQQADKPRYGRRQDQRSPLLLAFADPATGGLKLLDTAAPDKGLSVAGGTPPNHLPAASHHEQRGLLAWHRVVKGTVNKTVVQRFSLDQGRLALVGDEEVLSSEALPYGPTVLHIAEGVYFVGWTATMSADRKALGRFVAVAP